MLLFIAHLFQPYRYTCILFVYRHHFPVIGICLSDQFIGLAEVMPRVALAVTADDADTVQLAECFFQRLIGGVLCHLM